MSHKHSQKWLKEHFSDVFVKRAQKEGVRSRAVYKLEEIQEKESLLKKGTYVVDLGAAPGGWSEFAAKAVGEKGRVFALDVLPMDSIAGVEFIQGDFTEEHVLQALLEQCGTKEMDVVLSDMAPNMSGTRAIDQPRSMHLAELALEFATLTLAPNGVFLVKVFQGEGFQEYLKTMKSSFAQVKSLKPKASRPRSREVYLLGRK